MASNFIRRIFGAGSRADTASSNDQLSMLTSTFLESEQLVSDIDPAVHIAHELDPRTRTGDHWAALREQQVQVVGEYLRLAGTGEVRPPPPPHEVAACTEALRTVNAAMARFAQDNHDTLTRARGAASASAQEQHQAALAATSAFGILGQAAPQIQRLTTVSAAAEQLRLRQQELEVASGLSRRRSIAGTVIEAARRLERTVTDAAELPAQAERVIRSVQTRQGAIANRTDQIAPALSALLREFSNDCSADLQNNRAEAQRHLADAQRDLAEATHRASTDPDLAIADAARAREHLDTAERCVDQVLERLQTLRAVRADPTEFEGKVRFRLRDAQRMAVNHGLAREWGSVLDAQADRVERATDLLARVHPDYWSYLTELRAVDHRVADVVNRMRGQIAAS